VEAPAYQMDLTGSKWGAFATVPQYLLINSIHQLDTWQQSENH
jgi:hypothetical protein